MMKELDFICLDKSNVYETKIYFFQDYEIRVKALIRIGSWT